MKTALKIDDWNFPAPAAVFTNHVAILGKTGSGKTFTAKGAAERLMDAGERVCIVDPTSAWWGIKSSKDGKHAAFPVVIFGGEHADFPISKNHGAAIADLVASSDMSSIIDTQQMTVGERTVFFTDFAETLLRKNKNPLHLMIDEAHNFMPQGKVPDPQAGRMLHAGNNLVSMGRSRGLRIVLISQRPAKLHKDSLTQVETLIALRLIAPQDVGAVKDWIGEWADPKEGAEIIKSLPSLKTGSGWIWAPEVGILKRADFPAIATYDSSKAPIDGTGSKVVLAEVDMKKIEKQLETAAAEILKDDPKKLRARIAELETALKVHKARPELIEKVKQEAYQAGHIDGQAFTKSQLSLFLDGKRVPMIAVHNSMDQDGKIKSVALEKKPDPVVIEVNVAKSFSGETPSDGERRILIALAMYPKGRTRKQISLLSGYKNSSGGFNSYMAAVKKKGWMDGSPVFKITPQGLKDLGDFDPLPTGRDLAEYWLNRLDKAEATILQVLLNGGTMSREEISAQSGYKNSSGGFNSALAKLYALELVERNAGQFKASEDLQ